ncbi:HNH endonuclease [Streptomyces sp. DW26H14]|uniref:HNH endonuclease n=1 Tax=Streptomyces sp. DW26H14 TaxID=3435395 RepID=UPI00403DA074
MPTAPPSRCADPGCTTLTTRGRCPAHQRPGWVGRDDKAARYGISSGRWRTLKARTGERDNWSCYRCGIPQDQLLADDPDAEPLQLDHITPVAEGGSVEDPDNLGLICVPCHTEKSAAEAARGSERRRARRQQP